MKKFLLLMSVVLSFSFILVGCSDNETTEPGTDTTNTETNATLEPYEIKWYAIGGPPQDLDLVLEELNPYLKEKINATLDLEFIDWGEYDKKMTTMITAGDKFDIAFTSSWAANYIINAQKGAFLGLNDLMDQYGQDMKAVIDPAFLEGAKIDGELYAVPVNKEVGQQSVYVFNKRLVDKHNMDISTIQSLEDLEPFLNTIKNNEADIEAPIAPFSPYLPFDYILQEKLPFAVNMDGDQAKIVNWYDEPETMETLKTMHQYYNAGYIPADAGTNENATYDYQVENWFVRKEMYQPYAELLWQRSGNYEVVVQPMHDPITFNNSVLGSMHAISITSDNPERVMMFMDLLNTDPFVRTTIDKGVEGVHYETLDSGKIRDIGTVRSERYSVPTFALGNHFILPLYEDDPDDKWESFQTFNDSSTNAPTLGFVFDTDSVRTEIAAISNVAEQYNKSLMNGAVDPEKYLSEANKKFTDAGIDTVIEEMQKQYDEWRNAQG
ncbi:ABC transporter substrate-binding protein [Chengkuizengella sediminis]|uniref:ABC transporter substrate-binding protein n=1 Tax=Chengkuizengella sediminis TaxID=1885917 RepID=UPI00138942F2|nr:ABC transporter substrate-binding protein [Chengkuizengella sediminis]NDI35935.1 ABC transporter substrate-binding protein [Chengkuizengella sediminis]